MNIAIIDADSIPYRVCNAAEAANWPLYRALRMVDEVIYNIVTNTKSKYYIAVISGKTNFRYDIDQQYKASRADNKDRTQVGFYSEIKRYLIKAHNAVIVDGAEGDDGVAILNTIFKSQYAHPFMPIMVSNDKDLLQVPGNHYNHYKDESVYVNNEGSLWKDGKKVRGSGDKFLWYQVLRGDPVDGIKGIPGIGPVKAYSIIKDVNKTEDLPSRVLHEYVCYYGVEEGPIQFKKNFELVYIVRSNRNVTIPKPTMVGKLTI